MAPLAFDLTLHFVYGPEERLCLALEPAGILWEAALGRGEQQRAGPGQAAPYPPEPPHL